MTFNRVIYRPQPRRVSCSVFHGHTDTTRRQLKAWNTAVSAWRLERELPYTVEPTGAALAARSWEFLAGSLVVSPSAVGRGF